MSPLNFKIVKYINIVPLVCVVKFLIFCWHTKMNPNSLETPIIRFLYSLLFYCLTPFVLFRVYWRSRREPRYADDLSHRFGAVPARHEQTDMGTRGFSGRNDCDRALGEAAGCFRPCGDRDEYDANRQRAG